MVKLTAQFPIEEDEAIERVWTSTDVVLEIYCESWLSEERV